ncbi:sialic acid-binding Ig-like lectin 5 isoform X1 [Ochotona princeps]|uniref:sialic acid-binding Ig-like lectin 5 isoform X1 n=1 Tax=Ochotona princeps TaxID=9978 RepID=UPI0027151A3E|nr:sialic acid-binding Ig-like lectin 5 isoform X1 [Ochotona princeps]
MLPLLLLLLSLLCGGSLQQDPGYKLQVQESVTVQEGLCVLVPCSFSYPETRTYWTNPGRTFIFWFRDGDNTDYNAPVATNKPDWPVISEKKGRFHVPSDLSTNNCSLRITDARREDTGTYFLRVEKGSEVKYNYIQKKLSVEVTALTEKPHIQLPAPLQSGHTTELHCSLPGHCPKGRSLRFFWKGSALDSQIPWRVRSSLSLTPRPQDHGTNLTCRVQYASGQVTTERTVQLHVSYPPQNLSVSVFFHDSTASSMLPTGSSLTVPVGWALRLRCSALSNPPANLSWVRGPPDLQATPVSFTDILELLQVQPEHGGQVSCIAQNSLGSRHLSVNLSVQAPLQLLGPFCSWEAWGLHCHCSSQAQQAPSLRWRLEERLLEGNSSGNSSVAPLTVTSSSAGPWANSSLSLRGDFRPGLRLSCEAQDTYGSRRVHVLLLPPPGQGASQPGVVLAALMGAGAAAITFLCLSLLFFAIVKLYRKQSTGPWQHTEDEDPVMASVTLDSRLVAPKPDSPQGQPSAGDPSLPREQQELHYASLSFHRAKPREPQDQEATSTTEYAEIKTTCCDHSRTEHTEAS